MAPPADPDWPALVPELVVSDIRRSLAFWVEVLGFSIRYDRPEEGFAYLEREGAEVMLEQIGEHSWVVGEMAPPFGRGINLQIEVSNLDALIASLGGAGVPLYREPETRYYRISETEEAGQRQLLVQDPDGYLLRFAEDVGIRSLSAEPKPPSA